MTEIDFNELNAKLAAERARDKAFRETELGKLYYDYQNATIDYWRNDANDRISNRRLRELDEAQRKAADAFRAKLMELANV